MSVSLCSVYFVKPTSIEGERLGRNAISRSGSTICTQRRSWDKAFEGASILVIAEQNDWKKWSRRTMDDGQWTTGQWRLVNGAASDMPSMACGGTTFETVLKCE